MEESYASTTELADTIVRECNIPFRTAHTIVGMAVRRAVERGVAPSKISLNILNTCAKKVIGRSLHISDEAVRNALNPHTFISRRRVEGGPAPEALEKAFAEREKPLDEARRAIAERRMRIERAYKKLARAVAEYTKS